MISILGCISSSLINLLISNLHNKRFMSLELIFFSSITFVLSSLQLFRGRPNSFKELTDLKMMSINLVFPLVCLVFLYCTLGFYLGGCPRGVMVKAMDCRIVVSEFELQSRYYVHFRANTLGKGMNLLILPAMG